MQQIGPGADDWRRADLPPAPSPALEVPACASSQARGLQRVEAFPVRGPRITFDIARTLRAQPGAPGRITTRCGTLDAALEDQA